MMDNRTIAFISLCLFSFASLAAQDLISLEGEWQVQLATSNEWVKMVPEESKVSGTIKLPGSLAENAYGYKTRGSDFGVLTPEYKYVGKALYRRKFTIPENWDNKEFELFLERVLWESRVFIDDKELSVQDALGTPHIHKLGRLTPGEHELAILVNNDMIYNIGDKGHAYGEYTQSIWDGIVGRIELQAKDPSHFISTKIYSDIERETLTLKCDINSEADGKGAFLYEIVSVNTGEKALSGKF
jgi:hypothetical protein